MSRILILVLALAASLGAQTPPPPPRVPLPDWRALLRSVVVTPPRVCAIPLVNVLPPAQVDSKPVIRPPDNIQFPMQQIHVPAPACDNIVAHLLLP